MTTTSKHRDPETLAEWEAAARGAAGLQLIHSAQAYGFVSGGPEINADRCDEILAGAAERGIVITPDVAQQAALEFIAAFAAESAAC